MTRKRDEKRIDHLNRVLLAIRNVNQLIVRENDPEKLLQEVCNTLVETQGYHNIWIAILDESGRLVRCAEAGLGEDFLPMKDRLEQGEPTERMQEVLARRGVVVTEDPASACVGCSLSSKCAGRGAMTVRLEHGGKVYGFMSLTISPEFVGEEDEKLFEEVAEDIAFALYGMKLEDALRKSEEYYRTIFENSGTAMAIVEENGLVSQANSWTENIFGYTSEEIEEKMTWDAFVAEDERERLWECFRAILREPKTTPCGDETRLVDKWGYVKHGLFKVSLIPKTKQYVISITDITGPKHAEIEVRQTQQRLIDIIEFLPDATFVIDKDRKVIA